MKRLVFSKPVTRRLTPGSNGYTNHNTNHTRLSRPDPGEITGRTSPEEYYRDEITGGTSPVEFTGRKSPVSDRNNQRDDGEGKEEIERV